MIISELAFVNNVLASMHRFVSMPSAVNHQKRKARRVEHLLEGLLLHPNPRAIGPPLLHPPAPVVRYEWNSLRERN
jgi:hypothetical protein